MAKITLHNILSGFLASLKINQNFSTITTAFENTLSRNGAAPNAMAAQLDMGSNKVINIGQPDNDTDAVRLVDLQAAGTPIGTTVAWTQITSKPTTFAPSSHTHVRADITDLGATTLVAPVDIPDTGPTWASYTDIHSTLTANVNSYPVTARFGNNLVPITEAICGMVEVPATAHGGNACMGVSGYARTAGAGQGAVGIFGYGGMTGAGSSSWGGNFLVTNTGKPQDANGSGYNTATMYGLEIDLNIKKVGGSAPNYAARGLYIIGDSESSPSGGLNAVLNAVEVDSYGINQSPKLKWNVAYHTADGAATNGISLGTTALGNTVGSQPLLFRGRNSGGTSKQGSFQMDPDGNMVLAANTGGGFNFQNGSTVDAQILPGGIIRSGSVFELGLDQVVHQRHTGWGQPTGTASTAAFDSATVTLPQLAQRVAALILALHGQAGGHGLLGT